MTTVATYFDEDASDEIVLMSDLFELASRTRDPRRYACMAKVRSRHTEKDHHSVIPRSNKQKLIKLFG